MEEKEEETVIMTFGRGVGWGGQTLNGDSCRESESSEAFLRSHDSATVVAEEHIPGD